MKFWLRGLISYGHRTAKLFLLMDMKVTLLLVAFLNLSPVAIFGQKDTPDLIKIPFVRSEIDSNTEAKDESIDSKNHKSVIARTSGSSSDAELIRIAETVYPDQAKLDESSPFKNGRDRPKDETEPFWSAGSFDGVKIAAIVSRRALKYYQELSVSFRGKKSPTQITMTSTAFDYSASVEYRPKFVIGTDEFENVRVANLKLSWSQYCGNLCAMAFERTKVVVFDSNHQPIAMYLDAERRVLVS